MTVRGFKAPSRKTYPAEDFPAAVLNITISHNSHFTAILLIGMESGHWIFIQHGLSH